MGDFMWAVTQMKEEKKVRRPCYGLDISDSLDSWNISYTMEDFEATDWEVVEEKKTLSDKEICIENPNYSRVYKKEDVKEALKELNRRVLDKDFPSVPPKEYTNHIFFRDMLKAIEEIFGGRLIK